MRNKRPLILLLIFASLMLITTANASQALSGKIVSFPPNQRFAVYSGPGTGYFRNANGKALVSTNDWLEVYGFDQGWALIRYAVSSGGQRYGYIEGSHVPSNAGVGTLSFDNTTAYVVRESGLTDDPLERQKSMTTLAPGTEVLELAHMGEWTYLEYENMRGFIKTINVAYSHEARIGYALTNRDGVNIRESANKKSNKVTTINNSGTRLEIDSLTRGKDGYLWYHVYTSNGLTGYVREDFVDPYWNTYQADEKDGTSEMGIVIVQSDTEDINSSDELPSNWPQSVKGMTMEEAYLNVLLQYQEGIHAYETFQLAELERIRESSFMEEVPGAHPLYTLMTDLTGDGIPELLFMCTEKGDDGIYWYEDVIYETHLYIFSWKGDRAECILFFEDLYHSAGAYPWYTIYRSLTSNDLYIVMGNNFLYTHKYILSEQGNYLLDTKTSYVFWEDLEVVYYYAVNDVEVNRSEYETATKVLDEVDNKSIIAATQTAVSSEYNIMRLQQMIDWLKGIIVRMTDKPSTRSDWPSAVTGNTINEAYLNVLNAYRTGIEAFQSYQMEDIRSFENSPYYESELAWYESRGIHLVNQPMYVALVDFTGDGQNDLMFISANAEFLSGPYTEGNMLADLYIFTWTGDEARCILYVEEFYSTGANGPGYTIYRPKDSFSLYLNYTCNGPGTTECYVLNEYGYFSKWFMADVVLPTGDMEDPENEYTIEDIRGRRATTRSGYLDAMKLLVLNDTEYIAFIGGSDIEAFYDILTIQEMIDWLQMHQINLTRKTDSTVSTDDAEDSKVQISKSNFPDRLFRKLIKKQADADQDGWLSDTEIENVTSLDLWYESDLSSLQGIEYLRQLQVLDVGMTSLSALDVSKNTKIQKVSCPNNALSTLILGELPELVELDCSNNALRVLDVSGCQNLQKLSCGGNALSSLDVSHNGNLLSLGCQLNNLHELDVAMNPGLIELQCFSNQIETLKLRNPLLNQIACEKNLISELDIRGCTELLKMVNESERFTDDLGTDSFFTEDGYFTLDSSVVLMTVNGSGNTDLSQIDTTQDDHPELPQTASTNVKNVNVRSEARKNSKKVTTISKKGTNVTVLNSVTGNDGYIWYYVETSKGIKGYIRQDFLDLQVISTAGNDQSNPAADNIDEIYRLFVESEFVSGHYEKEITDRYDGVYLSYKVTDIDKDGTEELIVYTLVHSGEAWFYTYEEGNIIPLEFDVDLIPGYISSAAKNCVYGNEAYELLSNEPGILVGSYFGTGSHEFSYYMKNGVLMTRRDHAEIEYDDGDGHIWLALNGKDVTYEQMNDFFSNLHIPTGTTDSEEFRLIDYFFDAHDRWYEENGSNELMSYEKYESAYQNFIKSKDAKGIFLV